MILLPSMLRLRDNLGKVLKSLDGFYTSFAKHLTDLKMDNPDPKSERFKKFLWPFILSGGDLKGTYMNFVVHTHAVGSLYAMVLCCSKRALGVYMSFFSHAWTCPWILQVLLPMMKLTGFVSWFNTTDKYLARIDSCLHGLVIDQNQHELLCRCTLLLKPNLLHVQDYVYRLL